MCKTSFLDFEGIIADEKSLVKRFSEDFSTWANDSMYCSIVTKFAFQICAI